MAEPPAEEGLSLRTPLGDLPLKESVTYPNGGRSLFYEHGSTAVIVDYDICRPLDNNAVFDYSLITSKQNEYVARNNRVYRFLSEDLSLVDQYLSQDEQSQTFPSSPRPSADRADLAEASPLERAFEEHFTNVYGADSARFLTREYAVTDVEGHDRFIDYVVEREGRLLGVEENGVSYHHPQVIGVRRYRDQLLKQNSIQLAGIKLFRFSTEDCRFGERFEDDIRTYFGSSADAFAETGVLAQRPVSLYEHQEGALDEMLRRRSEGVRCMLVVLPTATGKSKIVEEDLRRFAPTQRGFKALIAAPNLAIVNDWNERLAASLPSHVDDILVCTYGYLNRHYLEYAPQHFDYIVIDEAHHAVVPALKRAIQYFDPAFLVGLTATDERPDKKRLETVFGSYHTRLSLAEAMEQGIVARANAYRIETNLDLSEVRINGRDYVNVDLEKTVRVSSRNELIVQVLRDYFCEGPWGQRQGIVFCVNVRHAREMERLLNEAGISAKALYGGMKHPEKVMADFGEKRVRFLCSCQMISEGWDYPELGILVMARPTLSRVLYLQQLGRGLRKTATKGNVFVIDVVDEYGSMVAPCSLHSIFQCPVYVPFGDVLRRNYQLGDWVEVDGIRERVERISQVDVTSFAERYEGYLSVEQLAREYFVNTGTINSWIRKGRIVPTVSFPFGSKQVHMFSPDDVSAIREELGIAVHNDETIRDDFFAFLDERDYSLSYKMPFLLSFLDHMVPATGSASIGDVLDDYIAYYRGRIQRGLVIDRGTCPYDEKTLDDRAFVRRSMLANPFEKFERKRFLYYSKDLGLISINHALQARLTAEDYEAVRTQMREDLKAYYGRLGSEA